MVRLQPKDFRNNSHPRSGKNPVNVLVVDDSAVIREVMKELLGQAGGINVATAANPLIAMHKMKRARPDVIVLDLEMPQMDGLTFLYKIMAEDPIPVVICSGFAGPGTEGAMRALEGGAVAIIAKPGIGVRNFLEESAVMLVDTLRGAAQARLVKRIRVSLPPVEKGSADAALSKRAGTPVAITSDKVIAIGASTGGTEALRTILEAMPLSTPGIVIVQHMPEVFTRSFAERLNQTCRIEVKEAANGDRVLEGRALIAPGNKHLLLRRTCGHYIVEVADGPLVSRHRPSVDVLFRSVACSAGPNAVGVIMTGMGDDGAQGLLEMKRAGAATVAQDEATSAVFGMPKEAISRGAVDNVVPLQRIPLLILKRAASSLSTARTPARGQRRGRL